MTRVLLVLALALFAAPLSAESFRTVESRAGFLDLVNGKSLRRSGVHLAVTPGGQIRGQAFGKRVTGAWRWTGGYFCRDLNFGARALGPSCELVQVRGQTLRFITERGAGRVADLRLD